MQIIFVSLPTFLVTGIVRGRGMNSKRAGISTLVPVIVAIIVIVLAAIASASFLLTHQHEGGTVESSTTSASLYPYTAATTSSSNFTVFTPSTIITNSSVPLQSSSSSYLGSVSYSPSCFVLFSGAVHVFGTISPSLQENDVVSSVKLYWSYHGQNQWVWLNDLTYGPSFSSDGNFSHLWNPPEAAYYDFEANWTLADGSTITAITAQPFQVVAQGSSCP